MQYRCHYALLEEQQKSFLEDSKSGSDDDGDCVAKNGHSVNDGRPKATERQVYNKNVKLGVNYMYVQLACLCLLELELA